MPSRKECVDCHGARKGKPASTCVACHEYHEQSKKMVAAGMLRSTGTPPIDLGGGARMLGNLVFVAIVLLLLVVLIPVGMAIFQRLRVQSDDRGAPRRPGATSLTVKIPPLAMPPDEAPKPAAPRPAPPPVIESTVTGSRDDQAAAPSATELVHWFGMLVCTSGPLKGQRWIIEEAGFWIGRDPALSQVVVNDTRVSKRHVRIVPRDGKVHAIDSGSTNGTYLAAAKEQRITDVQLKRGDTIVLAENVATFVYQI
jgi:hypothetical protein